MTKCHLTLTTEFLTLKGSGGWGCPFIEICSMQTGKQTCSEQTGEQTCSEQMGEQTCSMQMGEQTCPIYKRAPSLRHD